MALPKRRAKVYWQEIEDHLEHARSRGRSLPFQVITHEATKRALAKLDGTVVAWHARDALMFLGRQG